MPDYSPRCRRGPDDGECPDPRRGHDGPDDVSDPDLDQERGGGGYYDGPDGRYEYDEYH
jgi:hypothetical protein